MSDRAPILEFRNVEVCYGKLRALNGINLQVQEGEIVALLGATAPAKPRPCVRSLAFSVLQRAISCIAANRSQSVGRI